MPAETKAPPRLFEAVLEVNRRKLAGDTSANLSTTEFNSSLPLAALTCIDVRLNRLLPDMLGIPEEQFIWLRNAGNIVTNPLSSTMRSLALGCAIKGAKEIAVIGHTDCVVGKTTMMQLLDRLAALGVDRHRLPENLVEFFGLFGTEQQNVMRAVDFIRISPLIGSKVPVHGLMIDIQSGRLEWVVNGYQSFETIATKSAQYFQKAEQTLDAFEKIGGAVEEKKLPDTKIGELTAKAHDWLQKAEQIAGVVEEKIGSISAAKPVKPPPLPPPLQKPALPRIPPPRRRN